MTGTYGKRHLEKKNKGLTEVGKIVRNLQTMCCHVGYNQLMVNDLQRKNKNVIGDHWM